MSYNAPETRHVGPGAPTTPETVQRAGFTPIPIYPRSRAIAPRWKPGYGIDVAAGLQADGTWLHLLDLDSHSPGQNAAGQLDRIKERLGPDLAARLAIRLSRSGRGFHIIFRTATAFSTHGWIKVFDPLQPDRHIGELIGPGQRVTLTGEWIQHGPEAIPLLSALEEDRLRAAIHTPALYRPQNPPGSTQSNEDERAPRKTRMAEGLALIAGWEQITDPQRRLETLAQHKSQVEQRVRAMRRTPKNRSDAYCELVQSLMLHAAGLGHDLAERCRVVAALAICVGAAGKENERTYKIVQDTATLIARILHGDYYLNNQELRFSIPRWVNAPDIPPRPQAPTRAQAAPRTPGPLADNRERNIKRLLRYLRKLRADECNKRYTSIHDLAEHLRMSQRTISSYLAELRDRGAILSGQDSGNGPLYVVICEPPKTTKNRHQHAESAKVEPQATAQDQPDRHASQSPESRTLKPEGSIKEHTCIKDLGAPKPCGPVVESCDDQAAHAGASYDPAADHTRAPKKQRRNRKDPIRARLDEKRQRVERLRAMSLPRLLRERETLANAARDTKRTRKQRQKFLEMLPEIDHEIGHKRDQALRDMYAAAQAAPPADDQAAPPADDQAAPVVYGPLDNDQAAPPMVEQPAPEPAPAPGITRRVWRSPFVRCDWEPVPFVPHKVAHEPHPIATLGIDPESMRVAHEYCAAVLARSDADAVESG